MALGAAFASALVTLTVFITNGDNPDAQLKLYGFGGGFGILTFLHVVLRDRSENKVQIAKKFLRISLTVLGFGFLLSLIGGVLGVMLACMGFFMLSYLVYLFVDGYQEKELLRDNDLLD